MGLLGFEGDPFYAQATAEFNPHLEQGLENCVTIILERCRSGQRSTDAVRDLLELERQAGLMGIPTTHTYAEAFETCGPGNWAGTLFYEERGATNEIIYDPGFSNPKRQAGTRDREFHFKIEASIESVTESFSPGFGTLTLKLVAPTTGGESDREDALFEPVCEGSEIHHPPGKSISTSLDAVAAATNHFQVDLFLQPEQRIEIPGSPPMVIPGSTNLIVPLPSLDLAGRFIDRSRDETPDCINPGAQSNVSEPRTRSVLPPNYSLSNPAFVTQVSSNAVTVAGTGKRKQNGIDTFWSLQLNFKRKP
jgi:hypothetical protein